MTSVDFSECDARTLLGMITKTPKIVKRSSKFYTADEVDTIRGMNVARQERSVDKIKFYYLMLIKRLEDAVSMYEYTDSEKVLELKERIDKIKKII